jgi:hypothetical protein
MLNADNPANSPAGAAAVQGADGPTSRPSESAPKSLIVTGPVNTGEAVPNINLDKLLSQQSGAPITNKADEYVSPPGEGSREVGGAVSGLLDQIWQK